MGAFRPMIGHLLAFVVFVDGPPRSSAAFTEDEKTRLLRECFMGAGLLRLLGEKWGRSEASPVHPPCGFTVLSRSVRLTRDPEALAFAPRTFAERDALWMTEAYLELGFFSGSLDERGAALRKGLTARTFLGLGVADSFPVFVTKYPSHHPAFVAHGAVVLNVPELESHSDLNKNMDGVVAHEIGHIFDHHDEYGHCTNTQRHGFFDSVNVNCAIESGPRPTPRVPCLMDRNEHVVCPATVEAWGWVDRDHDALADLSAPATIELPERATNPGGSFTIKGRNIWDARAVSFGEKVSDRMDVVKPDEIVVRVPDDVTGVVTVSVLTRAGLATGPFSNTWVLVAPAITPAHLAGPAVFGVIPNSALPGTNVKIIGAGLRPPQAVMFGDTAADLSGLDPFAEGLEPEITVPVPPGPSGTVTVTVMTSSGTSSPFPPFSDFTYQ